MHLVCATITPSVNYECFKFPWQLNEVWAAISVSRSERERVPADKLRAAEAAKLVHSLECVSEILVFALHAFTCCIVKPQVK